MKIAVTSKGKNLDSQMDPRFGRAAYIIVVDSDTMDLELIDNEENANAFKGAGIQAAARIGEKNAEILITGFCGPKAFNTLDAAGIKVVNNAGGIVRKAIEDFKAGKYQYADSASAQGHWQRKK